MVIPDLIRDPWFPAQIKQPLIKEESPFFLISGVGFRGMDSGSSPE
jgi:hypothetical protein